MTAEKLLIKNKLYNVERPDIMEAIADCMEEYASLKCKEQQELEEVWEAWHNPMIHESTPYTISLHRTKDGAKKAVKESKKEVKEEHEMVYADESEKDLIPKWDRFHRWGVEKRKIDYP